MFKLMTSDTQAFDIIIPPEIKCDKFNINESALAKKRFSAVLSYYIKKMEQVPNVDLSYLYNNLKTLKIETKRNRRKSLKEDAVAYYVISKNTMYVYDVGSIHHELMHIASSICHEDRIYTGFQQSIKIGNRYYTVGRGLNEGFTDVLANRYFGKEIDGYVEEAKFASWFESVIGDKMTEYYFKADLVNLLDEASQYVELDQVDDLLENINDVNTVLSSDKIYRSELAALTDTFKAIYTTLLTMATTKWTRDYQNGIIDEETLTHILKQYFADCGETELIFGEDKLLYLTDLEKEQIIKDAYSKEIKIKKLEK